MNKEFWKAVAIRAIRTMCQTAVGLIPASVMITEVDWKVVVGTAALSGLSCVLTCVYKGLPEVDGE